MRYKKFDCVKCGNSWLGYAKKPKCRNCGSKMVNQSEAVIDETYLNDLKKKAGVQEVKKKLEKKVENPVAETKEVSEGEITPIKEIQMEKPKESEEVNEEIDESVFYGSSSVENQNAEAEEVVFKCSCGGAIEKGAIFCHNCGNALDIDWSNY